MSIILKGVNIPNSGQIEIIIRPHGKVFSKTRGISAEAIQIPKDHGRLIDMDDTMIFHGLNKENFEEYKRRIFEAHGILEAEE